MQSIRNLINGMFSSNASQIQQESLLENRDIPKHFICPISKKIMVEPVLTLTGHSYDKQFIMDYLSQFGENTPIPSPHDNSIMIKKDLFPNISLQNEITEFTKPSISDVDMSYAINNNPQNSEVNIVISLKPNTNAHIGKKYVTLVLDISGSMDSGAAEIESGDGEKGFKFSRLDLIKHASKVISQILTGDDYLSYSS
jgi:hypothetical protein